MSIDRLDFPEVDFERTALKAVICRLQFDPLLRIGEPPIDFQEVVRADYPVLEERRETAIQVRVGEGPGPVSEVLPGVGLTWLFRTDDGSWTVSLSPAHVGLETTEYTSFPEFEQRMNVVLTGLSSAYSAVERFTRVGLRYVNIFGRDTFPNADWRAWFKPELLGPMADDDLGDVVSEHQQRFVISEDDWTITIRHGTEADQGYRLDIDHATTEPVDTDAAITKLRDFNAHVYQIFRWTMSEVMLNELGPIPRA